MRAPGSSGAPKSVLCCTPPGSAAHGARPQRISGSVIITGFVRDYDGFRWNRRVHLHHVGHAHDAGDRREVADEIEIELVVERRVDRQGCRRPGRTFTTLQEPTKSCRPGERTLEIVERGAGEAGSAQFDIADQSRVTRQAASAAGRRHRPDRSIARTRNWPTSRVRSPIELAYSRTGPPGLAACC